MPKATPFRLLLGGALVVLFIWLLNGCAPHLQVARWEDEHGWHAATIRCSTSGRTVSAELASETTMTAREPTPEVP